MSSYIEQAFSPDQLFKELNHRDSTFYFARLEGQIVGYLKLNVLDGQTDIKDPMGLEIERIYVRSAYQGQRIGNKLIEFAIDQARYLGESFIWLGVWEKNFDAIRFYVRSGFKEFGQHPFMLGDDLQFDLLLKLDL
jgi:ribosomal protein S18 acetylase RimI-like enzyme